MKTEISNPLLNPDTDPEKFRELLLTIRAGHIQIARAIEKYMELTPQIRHVDKT